MKKTIRPLILPLILVGAALSGCNGQNYAAAPMPPLTPAQAYTEPEQRYANPGSLYSTADNNDLYADNRARRVGDIVLIKVVENSKSKSKADTTASRDTDNSLGISALLGNESIGIGGLSGMVGTDPMVAATSSSSLKGTGETKRENYVTATIGARVTQVLPGNVLQVMGAREIRVNNETQYMVVSGLIRTQDVSSDNSVESTRLTDSKVEYYGEGVLADKQKAGWLTRLLDTVWPL